MRSLEMRIRATVSGGILAALMLASGCREPARGPVVVSAIGTPPELVNPNLESLDPSSALLSELTAQGLVRFDASGQIEPALAQSWIVSDDGLRYTFRIARTKWSNGDPVTAPQVVARLRAALGRASKNPLKPVLGVVTDVEAMTENVLEISVRSPQASLLQLLARPEMAIIRNGVGTGPFAAESAPSGAMRLSLRDEEAGEAQSEETEIILRGEPAALAVARFDAGLAALVTGGTTGNLPIARAADPPAAMLRFDPVRGLFGLAFSNREGAVATPDVRRALSMSVDRAGLVATLGVPDLAPRETILPAGLDQSAVPAAPTWTASPLPMRRVEAARLITAAAEGEGPLAVRVAVPDAPGYRLVFAHLRRDWRAIGVDARAVPLEEEADLRLVDAVAPANVASWYLRLFTCSASPVCSTEADAALERARTSGSPAERRVAFAEADRLLTEAVPFIPLAEPVRWHLVSPRLTGFQANPAGRRFLGSLVAARR